MEKRLIVIPVYNEGAHLVELIAAVREYYTEDILVINDGSSDETKAILNRMCSSRLIAIHHPANVGYGGSLIEGFNYAIENGYDKLVTMDADWQHEPAYIKRLFSAIDEHDADIVSGSRYHPDSNISGVLAPVDRREINHDITEAINTQFGLSLTDSFCGFKAYRVSSLSCLQLTEHGYAFPLQFWVQAVAFGLTIVEIAVPRVYLDASKTFPGELKDASVRRKRYFDLLKSESAKWLEKNPCNDRNELQDCLL